MTNFKENLAKLKSITDVNSITIYESNGEVASHIPNEPGKQGSLQVYANQLGFESGSISGDDRFAMLETFAEHRADAQTNPSKHSNIDILLNDQAVNSWIDFKVSSDLRERVDKFVSMKKAGTLLSEKSGALDTFTELADLVEKGYLRTATFTGKGWEANQWVKEGLCLAFPLGDIVAYNEGNDITFTDKSTLPIRKMTGNEGFRVVPPASGLRRGSYAGQGATFMPPAYVNVGGYVGRGSMIESLVGSCAQVGKNSHISAGTVIGGVLDPMEATPNILGDNVLLGEGSGITQGTRLGNNVMLAPGVHISGSSPVFDTVNGLAYTRQGTYELDTTINSGVRLNRLSNNLIQEKDTSYGPVIPNGALIINGLAISRTGELRTVPTIVKYVSSAAEQNFDLNADLRQ